MYKTSPTNEYFTQLKWPAGVIYVDESQHQYQKPDMEKPLVRGTAICRWRGVAHVLYSFCSVGYSSPNSHFLSPRVNDLGTGSRVHSETEILNRQNAATGVSSARQWHSTKKQSSPRSPSPKQLQWLRKKLWHDPFIWAYNSHFSKRGGLWSPRFDVCWLFRQISFII